MKKEYSLYTLDLDTPQGVALDNSISSSISIRVEINDSRGIDLKILLDHNKALRVLVQFLKESINSDPDFLSGRRFNSINVCAPEYLSEPSTINNRFTPKENEIMALISEGESNREITSHIQMNTETFRTHSKKAFVRMNVKNRVRATHTYNDIKGEVFIPDTDINTLLSKINLDDSN
jgi:DNA-binding NarL/FixJ family response regulator